MVPLNIEKMTRFFGQKRRDLNINLFINIKNMDFEDFSQIIGIAICIMILILVLAIIYATPFFS